MEMEMTPELMYGQSVYADVESPMGTNHQNSLGYEAQDGYYPASTDMIGRPMPAVKHSTMAKLSGNNCFARVGSDPQKWAASEKLQPTSKSSGHLNADGISNAEKHSAQRSPAIAAKSYTSKLAVGNSDGTILIRPDQYNGNDLRVDYAKFFVIKSIVKADVHKSIKYGVWSSSSSGNRKLDCAFRDANKIARMDNTKCPVFLFFSVNGSGHFCGMAEMVGPVDFHKDMDFWFQDKWTGCFPVRWHIIKDVPNCTLQHILLQNNENNPVTHSRDIQEIPYVPGVSMVMIMKDIKVKECLFDDFMRHEEVEAKLGSVRIGRTSEIHNVSDEPHDCIVNKHQDPCVEGHCKVKQQHIEKVRSLVIQANKRFFAEQVWLKLQP